MDIDYNLYYPIWVEEFKRCTPWIADALKYSNGGYRLQDIANGIHVGQYQIWTCETAVIITQIAHTPIQKSLHLFLAGGDMDGVEELVRECEVWAKQAGCDAVTLTGREGWKKSFLKPLGFQEVSISMYKKLE